jgi:hypothetical protein
MASHINEQCGQRSASLMHMPCAASDMVPDEVWQELPPDPEIEDLGLRRAELTFSRDDTILHFGPPAGAATYSKPRRTTSFRCQERFLWHSIFVLTGVSGMVPGGMPKKWGSLVISNASVRLHRLQNARENVGQGGAGTTRDTDNSSQRGSGPKPMRPLQPIDTAVEMSIA